MSAHNTISLTRSLNQAKEISLDYVPSAHVIVDVLAQTLPVDNHNYCAQSLGLTTIPSTPNANNPSTAKLPPALNYLLRIVYLKLRLQAPMMTHFEH
jgi:hypothetical protein